MSKKILFVDDEPVVLRLMRARLESHGFEVETASGGLEGVDKARKSLPDAILLDVIMPGVDGFETCRLLKSIQETKHIPVFLFTASPEESLERKAASVGASRVVPKPHVEDLLKAINEFLG